VARREVTASTEFLDPDGVHAPVGPYSHTAVVAPNAKLLFIAGQVGMRPDGSIPTAFAEQAEVTFANLRACLAAHGLRERAVVRLGVFVVPGQDFAVLRAVRERHFGAHRPVSTTVYVPQLASPKFLIEVEAVAVADARAPRASGGRTTRARTAAKRRRET
jgi:enamine deaminase RidA (YjgF/YER057c/UK114 family)